MIVPSIQQTVVFLVVIFLAPVVLFLLFVLLDSIRLMKHDKKKKKIYRFYISKYLFITIFVLIALAIWLLVVINTQSKEAEQEIFQCKLDLMDTTEEYGEVYNLCSARFNYQMQNRVEDATRVYDQMECVRNDICTNN